MIKVLKKGHGEVEISIDGLPAIWFYTDEDTMNIPSPLIKSPEQARLFAELITVAANEWEKTRREERP